MYYDNLKKLSYKARALPELPGVYIIKDKTQNIIYIGKAKSLKDRVSQYFRAQSGHAQKVSKMVENARDFDYIITDSEFEALILECSLIKRHQPKYNILLKDDKGYHYIKVTNENWPRVVSVKQMIDDGAEYIGPYTSAAAVNGAVDEALKIFKLPVCKKKFDTITKGSRPCLSYHINQCDAPCTGRVPNEKYRAGVDNAVDFIKGGNCFSIKKLTNQMNSAALELDFEAAAKIRDIIKAIRKLADKQKVVLSKVKAQDVIAVVQMEGFSCFEVFNFTDGCLSKTEDFLFTDIDDPAILRAEFIEQYYLCGRPIPPIITVDGAVDGVEVLCKWLSEMAGRKISIIVPVRGEQQALVRMCKNNAAQKLSRHVEELTDEPGISDELMRLLRLSTRPEYIEAYDISNTAGDANVGAMVVFRELRPLKSAYRRFKIKNVQGQDDYASMSEVICRRLLEYEKLKHTGTGFGRLPDLILLDGGKNHVSVIKALLGSRGYEIPTFGMVKDDKHRTRAITDEVCEFDIQRDKRVFAAVTKIQDEVHRFAIEYHKKVRNQKINTGLTDIPGVGPKTERLLLTHFKTISKIKSANVEQLCAVRGINSTMAENVFKFFHKE